MVKKVCRTMRFICYTVMKFTIILQRSSNLIRQRSSKKSTTFPTRRFTTFVFTKCVVDSNLKLQSTDSNPLEVDVLDVRLWSLPTGEVYWCNLESVGS